VRTVVNVHPPPDVPTYVHRVGRTGRAGQAGTAVSLLSPQDATLAGQVEAALSGELCDEYERASPPAYMVSSVANIVVLHCWGSPLALGVLSSC
jgi:superfamily II DNA/RNA helicase